MKKIHKTVTPPPSCVYESLIQIRYRKFHDTIKMQQNSMNHHQSHPKFRCNELLKYEEDHHLFNFLSFWLLIFWAICLFHYSSFILFVFSIYAGLNAVGRKCTHTHIHRGFARSSVCLMIIDDDSWAHRCVSTIGVTSVWQFETGKTSPVAKSI